MYSTYVRYRQPSQCLLVGSILRNIVISFFGDLPTPLEAASGLLDGGVMGHDVSGRLEALLCGTLPTKDSLYFFCIAYIPDTCTRLVDTSGSVTTKLADWRLSEEG